MKKIAICGIALLASLGSASAVEPTAAPALGSPAPNGLIGEWVVEDGVARIRIVDCNSRLWGVIAWEKEPGVDTENPDRSKKTRPTLGIPILLNMKKNLSENKGDYDQWDGKVYNAENGKLYDSKIKLTAPDKLELKGCVLGFLCGGQAWTRYIDPSPAVPPTTPAAAMPPKSNVAKTKSPATAGAAKGIPPVDPVTAEICSLPEIAGTPH
jgi:uncharacterized protein (DUF2147 family)